MLNSLRDSRRAECLSSSMKKCGIGKHMATQLSLLSSMVTGIQAHRGDNRDVGSHRGS